MSIKAEVEGLGVLEFPDGTDPAVIRATVKRKIAEQKASAPKNPASGRLGDSVPVADEEPKPAPPPRAAPSAPNYEGMSVSDRVLNDLGLMRDSVMGLIGRGNRVASKALAGTVALPADAAIGTYNYAKDTNIEHPSASFNRLLDKYVAPPPETGLGKFNEDLLAGVLGGKLPSWVPAPPPGPARAPPRLAAPPVPAERIIATGVKHDVPVYFDDVTNSALAKKVGVAAESLGSMGTGAGRAAQNVAASDAARRLAAEARPGAVDDVAAGVQSGLKRQLAIFRKEKDRLYKIAADRLEPAGRMATPQFTAKLHDALDRQGKRAAMGINNEELMNSLETWKKLGRAGTFSETAELRSSVDDAIDNYFRGRDSTIGKRGVKELISLRDALDSDLESFANHVGGDAAKAWREADNFYKTNLVPFKVRGFKDLVKNDEPEKAWTYLLAQSGLGSRATRMYNALDDEGRQTVRYGLVKDAYDGALNESGIFSPAKFAGYMERNKKVVDQFFKGKELDEINGFTQLMRHIERAGKYAENPPTGNRLILPTLFGAGAIGGSGWKGVAATVGTAGVSTRLLFQTKTGRDLLLNMSRQKMGSPGADMTANRIARYLTSAAAQAEIEMQRPEEETEIE